MMELSVAGCNTVARHHCKISSQVKRRMKTELFLHLYRALEVPRIAYSTLHKSNKNWLGSMKQPVVIITELQYETYNHYLAQQLPDVLCNMRTNWRQNQQLILNETKDKIRVHSLWFNFTILVTRSLQYAQQTIHAKQLSGWISEILRNQSQTTKLL